MKFTKTLASVAAAAVAVSSLAVSAFATIDGADGSGNYIVNIADLLPEGADINDVYGATVYFTDDSAAVIANGAGGGFIFSSKGNNWNQLAWCNGCGEGEEHNVVVDAETNSMTRMEETPFFTETDISGADGEYAQLALSQWWGGDIAVEEIVLVDKDGNAVTAPETPGEDVDNPTDEPSDEDTVGETEVPATPAAPAGTVAIANTGKTVIDKGLVRTNIINAWAGDDACVIAEKTDFAGVNKIAVTFTVTGYTGTPFKAWLAYADTSWGTQFWGEGDSGNVNGTSSIAEVTGNGTYTIVADLGMVIDGMEFIAVCTDLEADENDENVVIPTIAIDSIDINNDDIVPGATLVPDDTDVPGETTEPTEPDDTNEPGETTEPTEPGDTTEPDADNTDTGVAVAVIPAAVAAAGLAVAAVIRKRK